MADPQPDRLTRHGRVTVNGAELHYDLDLPADREAVSGAAPTLLFVHAGICDSRMWEPQVAPFVDAGYAVLRPDLRGFGRSPVGAGPFRHRDDLEGLLTALALERVVLVGCSRGARHVLDLALSRPDLGSALVLVSPSVSGFTFNGDDPPQVRAIESAEARGDLEEVNRLEVEMWVAGPTRPVTEVDSSLLARVREMNRVALANEATGKGQELDPERTAFAHLGSIRLPTLIVTGAHDVPRTLAAAHATAARVPGAEAVEIARTAHLPSLERPAEWNALAMGFLTRRTIT